jgi:hypothetical protein
MLRVTVAPAITGCVAGFEVLSDCDRGHDCGALHAKLEKFKPGGRVRLAMSGHYNAGVRLDRFFRECGIFLGQHRCLAIN